MAISASKKARLQRAKRQDRIKRIDPKDLHTTDAGWRAAVREYVEDGTISLGLPSFIRSELLK